MKYRAFLKFNVRDLIWLITIVAVVCGVWMHGKRRERAAIELEQAARQRLATTELRVQQLEAGKAQQAAHAKRSLAKVKQDLASALDKLNRQEYLHKNSSDDSSDQN